MPGRARDMHDDFLDDARETVEERARAKEREWAEWDRRFPPGQVAYHIALVQAAARYLTEHGTLPPSLPRAHHYATRLWAGVPDP